MNSPILHSLTPDIETASDDYARRFSGPVGKWFLQVQENATLAMLQDFQNATVLDAGGGHAQLIPGLLSKNHRVTVSGSAPECRHRILAELEQGLVQFQIGLLTALPFQDQSFDVSMSFRQLPHLDDWQGLIAQLCRVARKSVIVDFPVLRSVNFFSDRLFSLKKNIEKNTRFYTLFWESQILEAFEKNGFRLHSKHPEFLLPMALHRFLKNKRLSSLSETLFRKCGLTSVFGSPLICRFDRQK